MRSALRVLRKLFQPLYIAAYVAWLAVLLVLLSTPSDQFLNGDRGTALAVLMVFLAAFVAKVGQPTGRRHWSDYPLLAVEGLSVLALCYLWPRNMAPVLAIIFVADGAMLLSAPALITVALALNVALWIIVATAWNVSQPWLVLVSYFGFQMFAALTAWYARRAEQTASDLKQTNAHLLATRSLLEESARDRERLRLARELHDVAGHKLTALKLNLTALDRAGTAVHRPWSRSLRSSPPNCWPTSAAWSRRSGSTTGSTCAMRSRQLIAPLPSPRVFTSMSVPRRASTASHKPRRCCAWCRRR